MSLFRGNDGIIHQAEPRGKAVLQIIVLKRVQVPDQDQRNKHSLALDETQRFVPPILQKYYRSVKRLL